MSKIIIIAGSGYSTTGGIQAANRMLVRETSSAGLLHRAHFYWDDPVSAEAEANDYLQTDLIRFYSRNRLAFVKDIFYAVATRFQDFILCTHVNYAFLGLCAKFGFGSRVGVLLHAAELDVEFSKIKRFALCRMGRVFTVSEYTKRKALALGVRASRIHVVLNGVEDPCPKWRPSDYCCSSETVLFVGRMDERYKGQLELIDAMTLLRQRMPNLRLVFVGDGHGLNDWKAEVKRRDLQQCVEFTGRISDEELKRRYATSALFAMPSENEGFGLVYAEAMAHGLPCIGGDWDAAREVIEHGVTGLCVPVRNSIAIADGITQMLRNRPHRQKMALASRERFSAFFSADRYRERLLANMKDWLEITR